jgi:hypothetical protein
MDIIHQVYLNNGCFFCEDGQLRIAEITYLRYSCNKMIIDSAYIHPNYEKIKTLQQLTKKIFEFAQINKLQITSLSEDIKQILDKNENYTPVVFNISS